MPPGITPPLILNYNASTVPILQLALSSQALTEQKLVDLGQQLICARRWSPCPAPRFPIPYRRQAAPDPDRPRPAGAAGAGPVGAGRRQRAGRAEPDHPGRHAEDRQLRIQRQAQQQPADDRRAQRPADQDGERRDDLHARRRPRARRLSAADQHRARRRQPLGADERAEDRLGLDAGHHRRHQADAASTSRTTLPAVAARSRCIGDQSVFVRGAITGVAHEGVIAALLTSLMILLFLGSWRSTLIIAISIPLAVLGARSPCCRRSARRSTS